MLSIIIPVYNERNTIQKLVEQVQAVPIEKEIVLVDDHSTDGTREIIERNFSNQRNIRVILHPTNRGKGAAVRSGFEVATGQMVIIQDADLEYNPADYRRLIQAMETHGTNVVYGSRFMDGKRVTSFWHRGVNLFLTVFTNFLYGSHLTDMETCYKLIRTQTVRELNLKSNGFEIEVELTAKILRKGEKITEVPVSYHGRSFHEGKKIGWKDGLKAVWMLLRYRFRT